MQLKQCNFRYDDVQFSFQIDESERIISETVEKTGVWEENQLSLYKQLVPAGGAFVDIGANVGVNTIYLAKAISGASVIAVEPSAANFFILQGNTDAAGVNVKLHRVAIADHDGEISFAGSGTNAKIATIGGDTVPCQTLDSFVKGIGLDKIDLMKIDVEGYSDAVLSASFDALSITKNMIMEFSIGDVADRFGKGDEFVTDHFGTLIARLRPNFSDFYYISRRFGLVKFDNHRDLFEMIAIESRVGDILATKGDDLPHTTPFGFSMRWIRDLASQNHLRNEEMISLRREIERRDRPNNQ
ncbi:FkbM family methyltransferase [Bosea sp. TAF32]|uniref:FkbM family methyltransferase n=1 Tax=Bosea sp. TAF32 TaxID=3237482 RepID=UPI003F8FD618